jgi:hypothetical protein
MHWMLLLAGLILPAQDAEVNEGQVRALAAEVEAVCGGRITRPPKVQVVDSGEFLAALKAELGDGCDPRKFRPLEALYQPKANRILFHRDGENSEAEALVIGEVEQFRRMRLFHELVHAWQYQNLPERRVRSPSEQLVMQALREGHAEFATRRYARRMKIDRLYERMLKRREELRDAILPPGQPDMYFLYTESLKFFECLAKQHPPVGIQEVLARGLPTERQIVYPKEYLEGKERRKIDLAWLSQLLPAEHKESERRKKVDDIGFIAFRMYMRSTGLGRGAGQRQLDGFLNGSRFRLGDRQITALAFATSEIAAQCFDIVCRDHGRRTAKPIEVVPIGEGFHGRFAAHRIVDAKRDNRVSTVLLVDRSLLVEVNDFGKEALSNPIGEWANEVVQQYRKIGKK